METPIVCEAPRLIAAVVSGLLLFPGVTQADERLDAETALDTLLEQCHPKGDELEFVAWASMLCLMDIRGFGHAARSAGPKLTPFLDSPNDDERLGAAATLGAIGYSEGASRLRAALKDRDWRVVYAATKSLGELRAVEATTDLQQIYDTYWLPEVRRQALYSLTNLKLAADAPTTGVQLDAERKFDGVPYNLYYFVLDDVPYCYSRQWRLRSLVFHFPKHWQTPRTVSARLKHNRGFLHGSNGGEWGGALTWKPDVGSSKEVYRGYNVTAIFPDGDGAIAVIGLGHMEIDFGIVASLDLGADGRWTLHEVARLPTSNLEAIQISPGIYAARSGNRVTVFNHTRILGLATCLDEARLPPQ